jgi:hypothetical protein
VPEPSGANVLALGGMQKLEASVTCLSVLAQRLT